MTGWKCALDFGTGPAGSLPGPLSNKQARNTWRGPREPKSSVPGE
jgi:hypothetical protein